MQVAHAAVPAAFESGPHDFHVRCPARVCTRDTLAHEFTPGLVLAKLLAPRQGQASHALVRMFGMGDVLMALCAARAIKAHTGAWLLLVTDRGNREIAMACPHVDRVICGPAEIESVRAIMANPGMSTWQLGSPSFAIAREHQVDAYLATIGIVATPGEKQLDLEISPEAVAQAHALVATLPRLAEGRARILLHSGGSDPNRTWPQQRWIELARTLIADGHQVVRIGAGSPGDGRWVQDVPVPGVLDAANRLSLPATVALMRQADLLVSTDSGPVQLAGASDIGIVGLYSVVPGSNRLPFRHGLPRWHSRAVESACPAFPCYHLMHDPVVMAPHIKLLREGKTDGSRLLANWCEQDEAFRCMRSEIQVGQVVDACRELLLEDLPRMSGRC